MIRSDLGLVLGISIERGSPTNYESVNRDIVTSCSVNSDWDAGNYKIRV